MINKQKRVAAIHDISGLGKCSLTVALPIISAAGVETAVIPTAVLSTHTGGIDGYTYKDLTGEILPIAKHWKSLNLKFDAIYTGFLGSFEQIDLVSQIMDTLSDENTKVIVDPCMADNGNLYKTYTVEMAQGVKSLCKKADIIVPNITEACLLLGIDYKEKFEKEELIKIVKNLCDLGCKQAVLTGVSFNKGELGALCFDKKSQKVDYKFASEVPARYHGTGDVFASFMVGALLNEIDLTQSVQIAADFTSRSINNTFVAGTDKRFGVNFEKELLPYAKRIVELKTK